MEYQRKACLLILLLVITACTHTVTLEKRLGYSSEEKARKLGYEFHEAIVKGSPANTHIILSLNTSGFIGAAHTYESDVGQTFNDLLAQAASSAGFRCTTYCDQIEVTLNEPTIEFSASLLNSSGYDFGRFTSDISVTFPTSCANANFTKKYTYTKTYNSDEISQSPVPHTMETVIIMLLSDIGKKYSWECK